MDKLRNKYKKLIGKELNENMSKVMLEKYISWYSQLKSKQEIKGLQNLLKNNNSLISGSNSTFVREYQGKKHEVSIPSDGDSHSSHPTHKGSGCFFYNGNKHKSLSKIAREITGTNWNGRLFFRVTGTKSHA